MNSFVYVNHPIIVLKLLLIHQFRNFGDSLNECLDHKFKYYKSEEAKYVRGVIDFKKVDVFINKHRKKKYVLLLKKLGSASNLQIMGKSSNFKRILMKKGMTGSTKLANP
jgi:hypothetical protein